MNKKSKITCKTGLEKDIINKEVFDREILLCKNLSKENNGKCGWGVCNNCGVLPLLYKLHKGVLIEGSKDTEELREELIGS